MFVALWEYEVKPGCEERFEKVYGPDGDWAKLFRSDSNYQGTHLFRDLAGAAIYRTLDFWNNRESYERFLVDHASEYKGLDAVGERLTLRERRIGRFDMEVE
jgi:Antibiotic biosynthesis monooxygenase